MYRKALFTTQLPAASSRRRQRGQSLIEIALALPILVLILAAVIDAGRAFDAYITITNAVREGARFGSKYPTWDTEIKRRVANEANGTGTNFTQLQLTVDNVTISYPNGSMNGGDPIRVTVTYDFPLYFGGLIGLQRIQLRKSIDMPIMVGGQ